jgi:hypothetical protein
MPDWKLGDGISAYDFSNKPIKGLSACTLLWSTPMGIGRNKLHNSLFNIAQRGNGPFSTINWATLDRWHLDMALDTASVSRVVLSDADRAAIGDEAAQYGMQIAFVGNAGSAAYTSIQQRIESVSRTSGQTVTASFLAKAAAGTPQLGIEWAQFFGTGGSPSGGVFVSGTAVTLSTTWTKYTVTATLPSVAGQTFGTDGNDSTRIAFWFSSGSANSALSGGLGVQSGTVTLWGCEVFPGSVAQPVERIDPALDLANCQRFALVAPVWVGSAAAPTTLIFPSTMCGVPGLPFGTGITGGGAGFTTLSLTRTGVVCYQTTPGLQTLTISADL